MERASRAEMPRAASTISVAIPVLTGWRQNSHSMVIADKATMPKNPMIWVRACADLVMPAPAESAPINPAALYPLNHKTRYTVTKPLKTGIAADRVRPLAPTGSPCASDAIRYQASLRVLIDLRPSSSHVPEKPMTVIREDDVIASVADALQYISYYHTPDFIQAMGRAYAMEKSPSARDAIAQILTNSRMCAEGHRPICQDTGIVVVFVKVGMGVSWDAKRDLESMINEGVRRAYLNPDNKLRASIVSDPAFKRANTRDNTPAVIHTEFGPGEHVEITVAAKGGGSENKSMFAMLNPRTPWRTGCSRWCRRWAPAGARPACSAWASAAVPRRPCCWPRNRMDGPDRHR